MMRALAGISFIAVLSIPAWPQGTAQQPTPQQPKFDIAEVRVSPRGDWVKTSVNAMRGGFLTGGRYDLHHATMLDLIKTAYSIDPDKIYGGPSWLDYDRFEVSAKAPVGTSPKDLNLMLQSLLAERFKLVVKMDTRPLPAYVLAVGKGKPKLKAADSANSTGGCQVVRGAGPRTLLLQCRGTTMETFGAALRTGLGASARNTPVVDSTGLEGAWDFDVEYGAAVTSLATGITTQEGDSLQAAIEKQLGLTLTLSTSPQPALVVESVEEQPEANPQGVAMALPPLPAPEFEVATIRPCDQNSPTQVRAVQGGGRVTLNCVPLLYEIGQVFGVNSLSAQIAGLPKWYDPNSNKDNFTLIARAPAGVIPDGVSNAQARDILDAMIGAVLVDRFKLAFHYEDRPMTAYTLVAVKPKLTKADPTSRTRCTRLNSPGGMPGLACQNMTMAQFAEQIQAYDTDMIYPVVDGTGLEGAWDFTVNYNPYGNSTALLTGLRARAGADQAAAAQPSEPSGSLTLAQALEKQLGLRLEKHTQPEPVMVIDHLEEKPSDN